MFLTTGAYVFVYRPIISFQVSLYLDTILYVTVLTTAPHPLPSPPSPPNPLTESKIFTFRLPNNVFKDFTVLELALNGQVLLIRYKDEVNLWLLVVSGLLNVAFSMINF